MRAIVNTLLRAMFSIGIAAGTVHAAPGGGPGDDQDGQRLVVRGATKDCAVRGGLCVSAGNLRTRPAPAVLASAPGGPVSAEGVPGFLRVVPVSTSRGGDKDELPWTLDVSAAFVRPAAAGNAMFILRDTQDPEQALATHMVTALWQAPIPSGDGVAVRMALSGDDGFRSGHTYQLRVVQLIDGKEVDLATGEVRLL